MFYLVHASSRVLKEFIWLLGWGTKWIPNIWQDCKNFSNLKGTVLLCFIIGKKPQVIMVSTWLFTDSGFGHWVDNWKGKCLLNAFSSGDFLGELGVKFNLLDLLHILKNRIQVARLIIMRCLDTQYVNKLRWV